MEIAQAGGGLPFPMIEMARARVNGTGAVSAVLPPTAVRTFHRLALLGHTFSTDELLALSDGTGGRDLRPAGAGAGRPRGRAHRGGLPLPAPARAGGPGGPAAPARALTRTSAGGGGAGLARSSPRPGGPPLPGAGLASRAVPYVVRAVEIAGALGAFRDALALVDGVRGARRSGPSAGPAVAPRRPADGSGRPGRRGRPTREAARVTTGIPHRLVRARLARAAAVGGDLATARSALAGLDLEGDEADTSLLLAQGNLAYFSGDMETARGSRPRPASGCEVSTTRGTSSTSSGCTGSWPTSGGSGSRASAPSYDVRKGTSAWPARSSTRTCAWRRTCSTAVSPIPRSSPSPSSSGSGPARRAPCGAWPSPPH